MNALQTAVPAKHRQERAREVERRERPQEEILPGMRAAFVTTCIQMIPSNTEVLAPMYPYAEEIDAYARANGSMPLIMSEYAVRKRHSSSYHSGIKLGLHSLHRAASYASISSA